MISADLATQIQDRWSLTRSVSPASDCTLLLALGAFPKL
jgi:hypothetical protein